MALLSEASMTAQQSKPSFGALLLGTLVFLVCLRSWVPASTYAHFDSDQAVFGLMGRDLIAGQSFPLFMYGQRYLLAVSVWLCAPLFALFGPSVTTLKLPMVAMNIAVVVMMWRGLRREENIGPWGAAVAILPFAVPSALIGTRLVEHAGGNIEPFVFTIGMYLLRDRAIALGLWAGIGFLNREFSAIGLIALLLMDIAQGVWRERLRLYGTVLGLMVVVVATIRLAARWSTAYSGNPASFGKPRMANIVGYFKQQLPTLLGAWPRKLGDFNILSQVTVGHVAVGCALLLWTIATLYVLCWRKPIVRSELGGMPTYLVLVGLGQSASFILLTPSGSDPMLIRYLLLSLLTVCGACALAWKRPEMRPLTAATIGLVSVFHLGGHLQLIGEYAKGAPERSLNVLADQLLQRNIRYATADYWTSYDLSFVTQEKVVVAPPRGSNFRMPSYDIKLEQHRDEVYSITNQPCTGGEQLLHWYLCRPPRAAR
jgi:hypothetical protein